jgi:hypothetical protein
VEAPVPTKCITRASTIGSIRAKLALLDRQYVVVDA